MMATLPEPPPQLKSLQCYMKTASDIERVDPVIAYWCRLYSVQAALKIDRKSPECVSFLTAVMDWMETFKKSNTNNEAVTNETVGQAHVENFVMSLFNKVDTLDRAGTANRNTIKMFFMAACLFEMMAVFGPVTEEVSQRAKYAKFKAAYIQKCMKNGETPQPGPLEGFEDGSNAPGTSDADLNVPNDQPNQSSAGTTNLPTSSDGDPSGKSPPNPYPTPGQPPLPKPTDTSPKDTKSSADEQKPYNSNTSSSLPKTTTDKPSTENSHQPAPSSIGSMLNSKLIATNGQPLGPEAVIKSQKYCKFAGSALQYDDIKTAVMNLEKALKLLNTGSE